MENRKIMSLQIGMPKEEELSGVKIKTAMDKKAIDYITVTKSGIDRDGVGNRKFHGGPDRALCFYPFEHYDLWNRTFNKQLSIPAFGENLTIAGMTERQTFIGDIYRIGGTVIQITQGRIPCSTISHFNKEPEFLKLVMDTNLTGYFARVIQEGVIGQQDDIVLLDRLQDKVTVLYATDVILHKRDGEEGAMSLLSIESLSEEWGALLSKRMYR
ncbi:MULTISPECIES: MOSC domain-containing protein [unclassified Peribacillus]|uniref:MOSC domain-containing protein n=1 Tax=unclassified Peribacillus TaxID=2675266 RepID=UPI003803A343